MADDVVEPIGSTGAPQRVEALVSAKEQAPDSGWWPASRKHRVRPDPDEDPGALYLRHIYPRIPGLTLAAVPEPG